MSKQFTKLVQDEELYEAICSHMIEIDLPKREQGMSLQDYGALIEAYYKLLPKVQQRLGSMLLEGQNHLENMVK